MFRFTKLYLRSGDDVCVSESEDVIASMIASQKPMQFGRLTYYYDDQTLWVRPYDIVAFREVHF